MSAELIAAYAGGSMTQAALVARGGVRCVPPWLRALRHPLFAALPLLALVGVVFWLRAAPAGAATLAEIALLGVPLLALIAAARTGLVALALVVAMVVVTLHSNQSLAGQVAALGLIAASCMVLGALLVEVTPPRWLGAGIAATAAVDLVLVASGLLTPASIALNSAGVTESLPQLQRVELGPLTMGYADLFLPALVGALLATRVRTRRWVALLTLCFALAAGLVFLVADRLPATVPVALALLVVEGTGVIVPPWRAADASAKST
ncbi:MAG TPA: hypothetical protein VFF79_17450 [Conexibacter sp.]|nr:hypothetical protein [Conexibacter sp.]